MKKKIDPFARANSARACSDSLALTELHDPAGRAKVLLWRKVGPASRLILPSIKGDPARRVTLFCFSWKRFSKFYKEMWEKLARPE